MRLQALRAAFMTVAASTSSSNSTISFCAMKFTVADATPAVFCTAHSILFAQFGQSTSIL